MVSSVLCEGEDFHYHYFPNIISDPKILMTLKVKLEKIAKSFVIVSSSRHTFLVMEVNAVIIKIGFNPTGPNKSSTRLRLLCS